jgi:glycosyltransferase involved in cell wall biosynthesis
MSAIEVTWVNGVRRLRQTSMEKYFQELLRAMRELDPDDLRIEVDETEGLPLPALKGLLNRYVLYSLKHLRAGPGFYHALDHANAHIMRLLPAGSIKLLTVHDVEQLKSPPYRVRDLPYKLCGRPGILAADRVVAVSGSTRDEVAEVAGFPRERIRVIHNGIDHSTYRPGPAPAAARPYLLYVGSEKPRKNVGGLLRVLGQLRGEDLRLVKAGRPGGEKHRRRTLEEARRLGVEGSLNLTGHVSEEELAELYRGALALVMPSLYEGFGIPVIEAMACGCPVVCSDIPPFRELAGRAVLRFAPDDAAGMAGAVRRLASDRDFRASRVELGLEQAASFSWERCAREHLELYREMAGEGERCG